MKERIKSIIKEIPNIQIVLEQMKVYFNIEKEAAEATEKKINQVLERMKKDG